jgi:hypothetical protein
MDSWFNEGSIDRVVRLTLGVLLLGIGLIFLSGPFQVILALLGVIALATGAIGICPLYVFFGINTK